MSLQKENKELHKLISINKDACDFYNSACEQVEDPQLKNTFRNLESVHNGVVIDLQQCIRQNEGNPEAEETLVGQAALFWGQLMARISNDVDETLVTHLEEAEDRCLHSVEDALRDGNIRPETKTVLQNELQALQKNHDYMKTLKDFMKAA